MIRGFVTGIIALPAEYLPSLPSRAFADLVVAVCASWTSFGIVPPRLTSHAFADLVVAVCAFLLELFWYFGPCCCLAVLSQYVCLMLGAGPDAHPNPHPHPHPHPHPNPNPSPNL